MTDWSLWVDYWMNVSTIGWLNSKHLGPVHSRRSPRYKIEVYWISWWSDKECGQKIHTSLIRMSEYSRVTHTARAQQMGENLRFDTWSKIARERDRKSGWEREERREWRWLVDICNVTRGYDGECEPRSIHGWRGYLVGWKRCEVFSEHGGTAPVEILLPGMVSATRLLRECSRGRDRDRHPPRGSRTGTRPLGQHRFPETSSGQSAAPA